MKLHIYALDLVLAMTSCSYSSSCTSPIFNRTEPQGEPDSTTVTLTDFNSISATSGLPVYYTITDKAPYAEITAPSDFLPYISLSVKNKNLSCGLKSGCHFQNYSNKTHIHIYGPAINNITTAASALIEVTNLLTTNRPVNLTATSSSRILLSVKTPVLNVGASSSGSVTVAATAQTASYAASSSAWIEAAVNAGKSVDATASSSGTIRIEGKTLNADLSASSSGCINAKNLKANTGSAVASSSGSINCSIDYLSTKHTSSSGSVHNN